MPGSQHERLLTATGVTQTEVFPLLMFAVGGMLLFPASNDLLTMFVALEVLSLPLYLLCGLARRRRLLSQEASLKYFLLGAFSSAFFLYGVALLYGYAGTVRLAGIAEAVSNSAGDETLLLVGTGLVAVGLLFKVGAAPFHSWTPDVYQGAPTPITGFMAACTKVAAFGALLRVFYVGVGGLAWEWEPVIWGVAILTMVVGSVVALTQTDVKRMLAYSSIAHAGFVLVGMAATDAVQPSGELLGVSSVLFYLLAYGFSTIGAFAVVTLVRDAAGEATHLSQWAGLAQALAGDGDGVRVLPRCVRRHPAHQRLHREVRRVPGGLGGRRLAAGGRRRRDERGRGVLLLPGRRADVLLRAGPGRPDGRRREPAHDDHHRAQRRCHTAARRLSRPGPRAGRSSRPVRPLGERCSDRPAPASPLPRPTPVSRRRCGTAWTRSRRPCTTR